MEQSLLHKYQVYKNKNLKKTQKTNQFKQKHVIGSSMRKVLLWSGFQAQLDQDSRSIDLHFLVPSWDGAQL